MGRKEKGLLRKNNPRLYQIWASMKYRCNAPTCNQFNKYGGRGISVYNEWNEFEPFYKWATTTGYEGDLTLDRIDNDGNYEPKNCRWLTQEFQNKNKGNCYMITINDETKTSLEWCKIYNLNHSTFYTRYNVYGWDIVKAITTPVMIRKKPVGFNTQINENNSQISFKKIKNK